MYWLHILLNKAALSLDDGLHPASEGRAGPGHHGLVHGGKVLLDGGDQGGLGSVGMSVGMCFKVAPHKIVQQIKIRTAGRPTVLGDQVAAVVLQPLDGPVGDMAGGQVLLPHPRTISCHCLDPGKDCVLYDLQKDVRVDLKDLSGVASRIPLMLPMNSMFQTFLEAIGALDAPETTCLVSVRAFLSSFTPLQSTPVKSAILLAVKMSPFLGRIITTAHLLSASVHLTSARGQNPVPIVLQLASVNS